MFKSKKATPPKRKEKRDLSQFGLFDIPDDLNATGGIDNDDGDDSDLEAELAAITAGKGKTKPKPKPKPQVPLENLDSLVAASLRDIPSDEELSGDEDDPDLLNELSEITGTSAEPNQEDNEKEEENTIILPTSSLSQADLIKERIEMYTIAEANAKKVGDSSKMRRFTRGLKTLKDLLKQANSGKTINPDDIPPEVSVKPVKPSSNDEGTEPADTGLAQPTRTAPPPPPRKAPSIDEEGAAAVVSETPAENPILTMLNARKNEYKLAALNAKRSGDTATALNYIKTIKQFDSVIEAVQNGQEVDLSKMPPSPGQVVEQTTPVVQPKREEVEVQNKTDVPQPQAIEMEENNGGAEEEVLVQASTIAEALQQRLAKYKSIEQAAKDEDNSSKARRYGRIVKQYQDAIKMHKAGKPIPMDDLPTPPGFGPFPVASASASVAVPKPAPPPPNPAPTSVPPPQQTTDETVDDPEKPTPPPRPKLKKQDSTRYGGNHLNTHLMETQIQILLARQKEFKDAAIQAKKSGEIEEAKEYLKIYKGFETILDAARGGLPVDMATLPIPPSQRTNLEDSFQFVTTDDCDKDNDDIDMNIRLQEQLSKQLIMCKNTRDHHRALGDVAGTNRFENLALTVQKDLDFVRLAHRNKLRIPKFHYEQKSFSIVKCNTDLTDNDVEINVIRGISYNVQNPKDVDTYVKVEFPYPQDDTFKAKTSVVKNTDSPEYEQKYNIEIQRNVRACQRIFKRQNVKFEIYSKGGFLRSDVLIGTVNVKLQPLETVCEIHNTFDLMDGRRTVGGKLEVKIRIRNPILTKQIEQINEKWLIIDS